jgi:hypothetical protein
MSDWEILGAVDPRALTAARLQLHWAAQAAAAVGKQLLTSRPDFSEQSFAWIGGLGALAQGTVAGARPFRSGLRLARPALLLLEADNAVLSELALEGRTLNEAYEWVRREVEALLGRPLAKPLERPEGLPSHPVAQGAAFAFPDPAAPTELARYFAAADQLLGGVRQRSPGASPVVCWPHHFDMATLIRLDAEGGPGDPADPETARSINVGLSPGDEGIPEPYFYVVPWPPPEGSLPALDGGNWHTAGWVGAVLAATEITGTNGGQAGRIERFLASAVAACRYSNRPTNSPPSTPAA